MKCLFARIFVLWTLCLGLALPAATRAEVDEHDVYILNTSTADPYTTEDHQGFQDLIVAEVFRRVGLEGRVEFYDASARALINANNDVNQGVAMRIRDLSKNYPNLVRVDEVLIRNDFVAYSNGLDVKTDRWESLEPYAVAFINGWVIFENNLSDRQEKYSVREPMQMFEMLRMRRTDMVLYERWQGLYLAQETGVNVTVHQPPLASVDMYMHVHKNHADLAPQLAEALRSMKADGTYQAIFDKTLKPLLRSQ